MNLDAYIYIYCDIHASLPQGNMIFEVIKRRLLRHFLVLTTLYFAWSYKFVTGKSNSTLSSKLFIVFDNVYIVYFCVYMYMCVNKRKQKRESIKHVLPVFLCGYSNEYKYCIPIFIFHLMFYQL